MLEPIEYFRIEFPNISVANENQKMVSECFNLEARGFASTPNSLGLLPFLRLGASPQVDDYEMIVNSPDEENHKSISPNKSIQNSGFLSSTTTSLSDDRNSANPTEKKSTLGDYSSNFLNVSITIEGNQNSDASPDTPTSKKESEARDDNKGSKFSSKEKDLNGDKNMEATKFGKVFSAPLGIINMETKQSTM